MSTTAGTAAFLTRRGLTPSAAPAAAGILAAALATLATALGWHGADTPNVLFRIELFQQAGFTVWNAAWYGGHHTVGYSALLPPLGAVLGPALLGIVSAALAAVCFDRLLRLNAAATPLRATLASLLFAAGTVTNVAVGRLAFALGLGLGLAALLAGRRNHWWLAGMLSVATALASPVAAAFLALTWTAWLVSGEKVRARWPAAVCCALTVLPMAAIAGLFPEGGVFPFGAATFALMIAVNVLALILLPTQHRTLRVGVVLYIVVCAAAFVVPNPLGGNVTRLGMYVLAPVLVAFASRLRLLLVAMPFLIFWQWSPAFDAMFTAGKDPSTDASYHAPLVDFLHAQPVVVGRIEIPFTQRHYEAAFIAPTVALARGWERQLDMERNPIFYETSLDAGEYHAWLVANGVQFVALPDVSLDGSAVAERDLLLGGLPYLAPAWHNAHWQVWRVVDSPGLISGAARLVTTGPEEIVVDAQAPGPVLVRIRWTPYWSVDGQACAAPAADDWTMLNVTTPGRITLRPVFAGPRVQC